ncbi:hypothetical protein B0H14DRAFT_2615944 [Mycena olivaceomarginata]|nr:hypothetical protein B0H14DRAFT_2615944 [Mycena olivaceomarginata]
MDAQSPIDLRLPLNGSIDTTQPTRCTTLLDQYIETINVFLRYDNVGNEVLGAVLEGSSEGCQDVFAFGGLDARTGTLPFPPMLVLGPPPVVIQEDRRAESRRVFAWLARMTREQERVYLSDAPARCFSRSNDERGRCALTGGARESEDDDDPTTMYDGINAQFADHNVVAYFFPVFLRLPKLNGASLGRGEDLHGLRIPSPWAAGLCRMWLADALCGPWWNTFGARDALRTRPAGACVERDHDGGGGMGIRTCKPPGPLHDETGWGMSEFTMASISPGWTGFTSLLN